MLRNKGMLLFMSQLICALSRCYAQLVGARGSTPVATAPVCTAPGIVVYKITMETFWSRTLFPKQYPLYRPHPQWSKVIGRTHDSSYSVWRNGSIATPAVKEFVDKGLTSNFDLEGQGQSGIFDMFSGAFINSGVGQTSTNIFMDSGHPLVSLLSKIVPSPDWFVGVNSINLCDRDKWTDQITTEMRIWDAGTEKGATFTAPTWVETPQLPIKEITASDPSEEVCSFFYKGLDKLPMIARLTINKLSEEETKYHISETQRDWLHLKGEHFSGSREESPKNEAAVDQEIIDKEMKDTPQREGPRGEISGGSSIREPAGSNTEPVHHLQPVQPGVVGKRGPTHPTTVILDNDVIPLPTKKTKGKKPRKNKQTTEERKQKQEEKARKKEARRLKKLEMRRRKLEAKKRKQEKEKEAVQLSKDCVVSDWAQWSACSKTCRFGKRVRTRSVVQASSGTGQICPLLTEEEMCGSMRGCGWTHFSSNNWGSIKN